MNKFTQEEKIMYALKVLGIPQHIKGYDYIGSAIELVMKDREYIRQITTMLYPDIAIKYGTTPSRVERAIRHAIETSFCLMPLDLIDDIFGNTLNPNKDKPTNGHFIAAVAEIIKMNKHKVLLPCE